MKRFLSVSVLALLVSSTAFAQAPAAKDAPGNNAINGDQKNSDAPVAGRNSFTEGQAKSAIEKAGYSSVTDLKKDDNGVWRGKASKGGSATSISVDFQGNVNAAK
jgi:opacity protein-like surface antigen